MTVDVKTAIQTSLRNHILLSVALIVLLLGGIAAWASTTQISGAVVAPGSVVVDSSAKKVQHPTGGIVSDLRVHDGDRVRASEPRRGPPAQPTIPRGWARRRIAWLSVNVSRDGRGELRGLPSPA